MRGAPNLPVSRGAETVIGRADYHTVVQRLKLRVRIRPAALEQNDCSSGGRELARQCDSGPPCPYNADVRLEAAYPHRVGARRFSSEVAHGSNVFSRLTQR